MPPDPTKWDRYFEKTWREYPRKLRKPLAYKAYIALLEKGEDPEQIWFAVLNYAAACKGKDLKFVLYGATFLHKDRWRDWLPGGAAMEEADAGTWTDEHGNTLAGASQPEWIDFSGRPVY